VFRFRPSCSGPLRLDRRRVAPVATKLNRFRYWFPEIPNLGTSHTLTGPIST
jgi:hypothetical protein